MQVKAKANQKPCILFSCGFTASVTSLLTRKEKITDTSIKPNTNLGKRSHIILSVGFSCSLTSFLV